MTEAAIKFLNSFPTFLAKGMLCCLSVFSNATIGQPSVVENQNFVLLLLLLVLREENKETIHMFMKRHHCVQPNTIGP